jgi:hypothetical protein
MEMLNKVHTDSIWSYLPRFFILFGITWTMAVIGVLRLQSVVNLLDYATIVNVCICGGAILMGTVHFGGNLPKECRSSITELKHGYGNVPMAHRQRKLIRRNAISLQLFGLQSHPIRLLKHNAIYLYFGGLINVIVTFLVSHPDLGKN